MDWGIDCKVLLTVGKRTVKLEILNKQKNVVGSKKSTKRSLMTSGLEFKLDQLRKELSSTHGGIFPHSVLSTEQISMISARKPGSLEEASFCYLLLDEKCYSVLNVGSVAFWRTV